MDGKSARVVVADDDREIRWILTTLLRREGLEVVEARDGPTALDLLRRRPADLLLLDYSMPGLGGLEVLARMRRSGIEIPVILISDVPRVEHAREAARLGALAVLLKPFKVDQVILTVHVALEYRRHRAGLAPRAPARLEVDGSTAGRAADVASGSAAAAAASPSLREIVRDRVEHIEREVVGHMLVETRGNLAEAARRLKVDYKTIRTKVRQYGFVVEARAGSYG